MHFVVATSCSFTLQPVFVTVYLLLRVVIGNRDEILSRPTAPLHLWDKDHAIIGGQDLLSLGSWLAISPLKNRISFLSNIYGSKKENAPSRGKIVVDYLYASSVQDWKECLAKSRHSYAGFNHVGGPLSKDCNQMLPWSFISNQNDEVTEMMEGTYCLSNDAQLLDNDTDYIKGCDIDLDDDSWTKMGRARHLFSETIDKVTKVTDF